MLDQLFFEKMREVMRAEVDAVRDEMRKEFRSLKHGDRISYNLKEAAELTGITTDTLRARCKAGKLAYCQLQENGTIVIMREDLERYLDEHKQDEQTAQMKVSTR